MRYFLIENNYTIANVALKELGLLERHIDILNVVKEKGPIGIIRLSQIIEQPEHMIRYSLKSLEKNGIIEPSPNGAMVTENINELLKNIDLKLDYMDEIVNKLKNKIKL
jgi:predicted transcriptional regulator